MSAFMCSDRHLCVLAAYAVRHVLEAIPYELRSQLDSGGFERRAGDYKRTVGRVAVMLALENLSSIEHRYPGDHATERAAYETIDVPPTAEHEARTLPRLAIVKACHCYAYQACEHPGWETSAARKLINAIETHAVRELPGYNDLQWGL